ncbi:hypothetical protein C8F01DRAFT_1081404 [Mycena amicta]|nr:hypothetical protein C8F01DRAFT_1081404 [Mycena amicta]
MAQLRVDEVVPMEVVHGGKHAPAESCTLGTCVRRRCMTLEVGSRQDGVATGQVDLSGPSKVGIVTTSHMHRKMLQLSFGQVQVALYQVAFNKVEDALVKVDSWKVALVLEEHGAETEVV